MSPPPIDSLCRMGSRVNVFNGRRPSLTGTVVGAAFHLAPGQNVEGDVVSACVIRLDAPFDSPDGYYVRFLVVPPGEFEERA